MLFSASESKGMALVIFIGQVSVGRGCGGGIGPLPRVQHQEDGGVGSLAYNPRRMHGKHKVEIHIFSDAKNSRMR